ncbi:MAG: hypothetical protein U0573_04855 [Phycisphaerales bacterium]|nr:hypothetical protein [Planctomycetota bacterium]
MKIPAVMMCAMIGAGTLAAGPVITGFNAARGGALSLKEGSATATLRASIAASFPNATLQAVGTVTAGGLSGCDVVMLASPTGGVSAIAPLTSQEQTELLSFVLSGHGAVIFSDNDSFAGGASQPANLSLLAPFGMTCTGTGPGWMRAAAIANPSGSPVTDGPFGVVNSYAVGWSGWFQSLGSSTVLGRLADNNTPSLAVIPRGVLGPGSGPVVIFSDSTMIYDGYYPSVNVPVVMNAIAFAAGPGCPGDFNSDDVVNDADFSIFVRGYDLLDCSDPLMQPGCPADLNSDGMVDDADFVIFVAGYDRLVCP